MTFFALAAFAAAAAQAAAPPWAVEPPPRLPSVLSVTLDRYRYFTDCLASREWVTARPLFDAAMGSEEESGLLQRITGGSRGTQCSYADRMRMTAMLLRGGIAESRYRQVCGDEEFPPAGEGAAEVPAGASFAWVGFGRESPARLLRAFAGCLAVHETGAVHAVLMTRIGRREERAAYHALSRRFGTCLVPGQRLRANSLTLRPWHGEALYQLSRSRRPDAAD